MPPSVKTMECLIPVINKIEDVMDKAGTKGEINLPHIAVIGEQSVGKTSVLESIVGIPFLPKGNSIETRTPIVIRLVKTKTGSPWCKFEHKDTRFWDFKQVEQEIRARTKEIAGSSNAISKDKIKLTIFSPKVLTLTVVDLPGITKVAVNGQPENIEEETKNLIMEFIEKKETIILAVAAGNVNIANSYSIQLAKQVDPEQNRTIVVITKVDRATEDLNPVLKGETIPMKLGIIGVINPESSTEKQDFEQARLAEEKYLRENYPDIAHLHGSVFLSGRLNTILIQHIRDSCPNLNIRVKELIQKHTGCLAKLGESLKINSEEKRDLMSQIVDKFAKEYKAQVDGQSRSELVSETLTQGARLDAVILETLPANLDSLLSISSWTDFHVLTLVRNCNEVGCTTVSPGPAVEYLCKLEIKKMKPVVAHITSLFHQEMLAGMAKCSSQKVRFPALAYEMETIIQKLLEERLQVTQEILDNYITIQVSSGLTSNAEYCTERDNSLKGVSPVGLANIPFSTLLDGGTDPLLTLSNGDSFASLNSSVGITDEQKKFCEVVKTLVEKYFGIVRKQVQDFVPKALLHSLGRYVADDANRVLMSKLLDPTKIEALIRESPEVENTRMVLKQELTSFSEASQLLEDIRAGTFQL